MDRDYIPLTEQLVPRNECGAHFSRAPGREILAPGDHLHTEGVADLCDRTADVAQTQDTERPSGQVITDRLLPSAAAQRRVLGDEIAGAAQDECPGQFDRRRRGVARMNDLHAPLFCSLEIDRGIPGRRRGDQAELGQVLDDSTRHRRALPHTQTMSNGCRRSTTASESARWSSNTVTVARPSSTDQSASER